MKAVQRDRIGATRGKLAAVGVLAVVLVGIVVSNFRGAAQASTAEASAPIPATSTPPAPAPPIATTAPLAASEKFTAAAPFGQFAADDDWPEYSLEKLVSFDPLATPAWIAQPAAADAAGADAQSQSLEQLQDAQSAIILVTGDHRVARIGSQEYRVGDQVGPYLITDISSAGIVLSEADNATKAVEPAAPRDAN